MGTLTSIFHGPAHDDHRVQIEDDVISFLRENSVPETLIDDFSGATYNKWIPVASLSVMPLNRLKIENTVGPNAPCIKAGYLILAGGVNGDPVAVNIHDQQMVYIFHDVLWESDAPCVEDCAVQTGLTYDEFWTAAASDDTFPADAYEADRRWGRPGWRMA